MSADDSIEIEFPSLKQSAPQLVERVEPKRAPGPIEAQLSGSSVDDDLSWLSSIFADDADDDDDDDDDDDGAEAEVEVEVEAHRGPGAAPGTDISHTAADALPDPTGAEPPVVLDGVLNDPPSDLSDGSADVFESDEGDEGDISPPPVRLYADGEMDDDAPDESEQIVSGSAPGGADRDPIAAGTDLDQPEPPSKKVTGFREEIMSTFSQMYN